MILIIVVLLLFGGSQIPKLARNLGLAQKELKDALKGDEDEPVSKTESESKDSKDVTTP